MPRGAATVLPISGCRRAAAPTAVGSDRYCLACRLGVAPRQTLLVQGNEVVCLRVSGQGGSMQELG